MPPKCTWLVFACTLHAFTASAALPAPFSILDPSSFTSVLQEDAAWAQASIPYFEASDANLTAAYFYRWRTYKRHIVQVAVNTAFDWVVTEFQPDVPWAGRNNTIPCAAGHHIIDGRWMRTNASGDNPVMDSYIGWWLSGLPDVLHNYYFWLATATRRQLHVAGDAFLPQVAAMLPNMTALFASYATGELPSAGGNSAFSAQYDCLWNVPGNEGQENALSGPGCRPLVNALMYGEADAIAYMCAAVGNASCAAQFAEEAALWRARVMTLWNADISSFATLNISHPTPAPPPVPSNYVLFTNASIFCCDQAPCIAGHSQFLYQGQADLATCVNICDTFSDARCHYMTVSEAGYCMAAEYCNTTNPFAGSVAFTFQRTNTSSTASLAALTSVRELASLTSPWFFGVVPAENASLYASSWDTAFDSDGLGGPYGLRTAEARAPGYACASMGCCRWSGPTWPFETSKALRAAIDILQLPSLAAAVPSLSRSRLWTMVQQYTAMHTPDVWMIANVSTGARADYALLQDMGLFLNGSGDAWIAEAGCGDDAQWTDDATEGFWYNHASYQDIIICGVAGVMPHADAAGGGYVDIAPLQPSDAVLAYWAVDAVLIAGRTLAVLWDLDGSRYGRGSGLQVYLDGVLVASADTTQGPALRVVL